ncbi:MFS transporter [Nocardia carnea]|uniref:MFS transporter n=1 Tax=Nocardia carnea TaxID=37328 RepID=UPI002456BB64|nr:MFS transporter [Nocardia carnea]
MSSDSARSGDTTDKSVTPERPTRYYIAVLVATILLFEIAPLELSMVYPSLRYMAGEFRTPNIGWVLTIVSLVGMVCQPVLGKLGDIYGKKRVLMCIAGMFAVGSLICAVAPSFPILLIGRALQASSVGITAVAYGLIRDIFPARLVPIALAAVSTGIGLNGIVGPLLGGYLATTFGYQAIFWFLLCYVAVLAPVVYVIAPESPLRLPHRLDLLGALLLGSGAGLLLLGISQGGAWGWTSMRLWLVVGLAVVLLALFVGQELRSPQPLIDIRLIWGRAMRMTLLASFLGGFVLGGYSFLLPLMMESPRVAGISYGFGLSALGYALWTSPLGVGTMVAGPLGGLVAKRVGPRTSLIMAMTAFTVVLGLLAFVHEYRWQISILVACLGIGMGFFYASGSNLVVEAVPASKTSASAGVLGCSNSLGVATGVTVLGAVLSANVLYADAGDHHIVYSDNAFVYAFCTASAIGAAGLVVALIMRHGRTPASGGVKAAATVADGRDTTPATAG